MEDLLACCTEQLGLRCARRVFTKDGKPITEVDQFSSGEGRGAEQEVFVSCGEAFIDGKQVREEVSPGCS